MSNIIDRRKNSQGKSTGNRQRFIKRVEHKIKKAIPDIIGSQGIKEISSGKGKVKIPIKGIKEPTFKPDFETGNKKYVQPGNDIFKEGDKIPRPKKGEGMGQGRGGSKDAPTTEDDFVITLDREEFLQYFFQDLELPNMVKKYLESVVNFKRKRAGYVKDGIPARLNIVQSFKKSISRRIGIEAFLRKKLKELEEKLATATIEEKKEIEQEIEKIQKKLLTIPFLDKVDLKYNNFEKIPIPTTSAVMFCIMDVSGSMGFHEKDIAKRFFVLLYIFLTRQYEQIDLVFIRHHTEASEVTEEEFFNSIETGGTVVATSLELCNKIIKERYDDNRWNIYVCQASDGDVWGLEDALDCQEILEENILPSIQYMAYIEINGRGDETALWETYQEIAEGYENFTIKKLFNINEIWPVFKDLFKKKEVKIT